MKTRVQKWGNRLAVRISLDGSRLVIQPIPDLTLGELLKGVTVENSHGEWETGPAVGREVW